jgi:hypothetical protein
MAMRGDALQESKENFAAAKSEATVSLVVDVVFAELSRPAPAGDRSIHRLPVCRHLAKATSPKLARLGALSRRSSPRSHGCSGPRADLSPAPIGPKATPIEARNDIAIGASCLRQMCGIPTTVTRPKSLSLIDAKAFSARQLGLDGVGSREDATQRTAHH